MLYIVDGTGVWNEDQYKLDMATGFCKSIEFECLPNSYYERGPSWFGGSGKQVASLVYEIMKRPKEKVFLCGYSRGGASVIMVAAALKLVNRPVEALFLFDPVDSDLTLVQTETIPANVKVAYYARRNPIYGDLYDAQAARQRDKAARSGVDAAKKILSLNVIPGVPSVLPINPVKVREAAKSVGQFVTSTRDAVLSEKKSFDWKHGMARRLMFENCGLKAAPGVRFVGPELFDGTHAAMGGVTWPEEAYPHRTLLAADKRCIAAVNGWMRSKYHESGLISEMIAGQSNSRSIA